jgi:hypothetical protein
MTHLKYKIKQELKDDIKSLVSIIKENPDNKEKILNYVVTTVLKESHVKPKKSEEHNVAPVVYDENGYPRF